MASSGLAIEMMMAFGQYSLMPSATCFGDLEVDGQQLFAGREGAVRARLARHAGGVDDELGAVEGRVVLGTDAADIGADGRQTLGDVEALALGDRLLGGDLLPLRRIVGVDEGRRIGQTDLARQPPLDDLLGKHSADVAATDETDFVEHFRPPFLPGPAYRVASLGRPRAGRVKNFSVLRGLTCVFAGFDFPTYHARTTVETPIYALCAHASYTL